MKKLFLSVLTFSLIFNPVLLNAQENLFPDVSDSSYIYFDSIQNFKEEGKVEGYQSGDESGYFLPLNRVLRAEFAKIVAEALADEGRLFTREDLEGCGYEDENRPPDVEKDSWYECYLYILDQNNILTGNDDGTMAPGDNIEFSEMAKILAEAFGLDTSDINPEDSWEDRYTLYFEKLAEVGATPYSIASASTQPTRGETVEATYRLLNDQTDKVTKTAEGLTSPFPYVETCTELEEAFHQYQYGYAHPAVSFVVDDFDVEEDVFFDSPSGNMEFEAGASFDAAAPVPAEAPMMTAGASSESKITSSDGHSQTNVQVEGVDEADIVKTDGEYIYVASQLSQSIRIVRAHPGEEMEEVAEIQLMEESLSPQELYINGDKLVVISNRGYYGIMPLIDEPMLEEPFPGEPIPVEPDGGIGDGAEPLPETETDSADNTMETTDVDEPADPTETSMILPVEPYDPYYYGPRLVVSIYNISEIKDGSSTEAVEERKIDLGSNYHTSRLTADGQFVLVANSSPYVWGLRDDMEGEKLLPTISENNGNERPIVSCSDVQYAPGVRTPNFMTLLSFDINSPNSSLHEKVVMANSESIYMSVNNNLYVTNTYYSPDMYTDWRWGVDEAKTRLYKLNVTDEGIEFSGHGEVEGTVLNQFSMDEFKDHLRIATTKGNLWDEMNPAVNNVYVLDADDMNVVGELEGLAPNERIYSTRFVGNRLYMVTFRQVDPLFVIDLEDPTNPNVLGKLKIPGYSDYLHPVSDNALIGFGRDTVEDKFGVLMRGFKMGYFDVSDPEDPKQLFTEVIGDRGTESELLWNHKALFYDGERRLIGFPITEVKEVDPPTVQCEDFVYSTCPVDDGCVQQCEPSCTQDPDTKVWTCTDDCDGPFSCFAPEYTRTETTFSGAVLYSFDEEIGFTEEGRITHYTEEDILKFGDWWGYDLEQKIQRMLYIGDYFYTVAFGGIKVNDLNLEEVKYIELE